MADRNTIVTYRGLADAFSPSQADDAGNEVVPAENPLLLARRAAQRITSDPAEQVELVARFSSAMSELRAAEAEAGPGVLASPQSKDASVLQSFLYEIPEGSRNEVESDADELTFAPDDLGGWFLSLFQWFKRLHKRDQRPPTSTTPETIADNANIFIVADWGTGLYGAPVIADTIKRQGGFEVLLHLGDVYYAGTKKEVQDRFLDKWPKSAGRISRALNSNHEMYSGGEGYFDLTLPAFNQPFNYFAMANKNWLLICLDSGYHEHTVDDEQAEWVENVIAQHGANRSVLLFSHHQLFSLYDSQGPKLARQLHKVLTSGKVVAWYCGHEHRCVLYNPHPIYKLRLRCLGHGGMPCKRENFSGLSSTPTDEADTVWYQVPARDLVPGGLVLDGPNREIKESPQTYGPNGYMTLEFAGAKLIERVFSPTGVELWNGELPA